MGEAINPDTSTKLVIDQKLYAKFLDRMKCSWALLLDLILHDLHINLLSKNKTEFSSIFLNAGAHIQHHYFFNSKYYKNKNTPQTIYR